MLWFLFFTFILAIVAHASGEDKPVPDEAEVGRIRVRLGHHDDEKEVAIDEVQSEGVKASRSSARVL